MEGKYAKREIVHLNGTKTTLNTCILILINPWKDQTRKSESLLEGEKERYILVKLYN